MPVFALVDCNNFYASCERVFNHKLRDKPIVILSNNDGCVISRSNEAKALGIAMGAPYFEYKKICLDNKVTVLSSNYQYYGDMSNRVMTSFKYLVDDSNVEIYSIDEAFLNLDKLPEEDLTKYAHSIKDKIVMWTGLPVSIGIGPSKTLAKVANFMAKKSKCGVFNITDKRIRGEVLTSLKVGDIWGIGKRIAIHLGKLGITTAAGLRDSDPKYIRKIFGVEGERIVRELNGVACFELETNPQDRQNIMTSRSFGTPVTELTDLQEAIADYAARACVKMRGQESKAQGINVFVQTNWHKDKENFYQNGSNYLFDTPTDDTSLVICKAKEIVKALFKPGLSYKKVGICLLNLGAKDDYQGSFFNNPVQIIDKTKKSLLMQSLDKINQKMGRNTIFFAAQGIKKPWVMKSGFKSPHYTTNWKEIPMALA